MVSPNSTNHDNVLPQKVSCNPGASIYLEGKSLHLMWGSTTNSPSKTTKIQSWNNILPLSQHPLTRNWHRQRTNSPSKTTPKLSAIVGVLFVLFENSWKFHLFKNRVMQIVQLDIFLDRHFPHGLETGSNKNLGAKMWNLPESTWGVTITHNKIFRTNQTPSG